MLLRLTVLIGILLAALLLARRYFIGLYFYPDSENYGSPSYYRIPFEELAIPSSGGRTLSGYLLKCHGNARGLVVHCHGNAANITNHFPLVLFLVKAGYDVLTFDYAGFGASKGRPSPRGVVADTLSVLSYVHGREDLKGRNLFLFGQSLGGAAAAGAMRQDPSVRGLILEATFTTYRAMGRATSLGRLMLPFTWLLPDEGPLKDLPAMGSRPVLFLHGEADDMIPPRFTKELYAGYQGPKKLLLIPGFAHLDGGDGRHPIYEQTVLSFLGGFHQ